MGARWYGGFIPVVLAAVLSSAGWAANPIAVFDVTSDTDIQGVIALSLWVEDAPVTTANIRAYIEDGFYEGLVFHRTIENFMIQFGGYDQALQYRTPPYDPIINESDNGRRNLRGTAAMARTSDPNSATSQFFINHVDNGFLDRDQAGDGFGYAVFGAVVAGMDLVDTIAVQETIAYYNFANLPAYPIWVSRAGVFDADSDDFAGVPFLQARAGDIVVHRGQGQYAGRGTVQRFTAQQRFGVACLRMEQYEDDSATAALLIVAAVDSSGGGWLFEMHEQGQVLFAAADLSQIKPFASVEDIRFQLMAGNASEGLTVNEDDGGTAEVVSVEGDTVLVRRAAGDAVTFTYYDEAWGKTYELYDPNADVSGDGYRLEQDAEALQVDKCAVKRGPNDGDDMVILAATLPGLPAAADEAYPLRLRFGPLSLACDVTGAAWKETVRSIGYRDTIDGAAVQVVVNKARHSLLLKASGVDLSGLSAPIPVEVARGDFYAFAALAEDDCRGLNAQFLTGAVDYLSVDEDRSRLRLNSRKAAADMLQLQGELAVADRSVNLATVPVTVRYGDAIDETLAAGAFSARGSGYQYRQARGAAGVIQSLQIDLGKGTFKLAVANADLAEVSGAADFQVQFGSFDQTVAVTLSP